MDIMNIFCQSLGVTSHAKTLLTVCCFRTDLVSVQENCHPFKRLRLSVWKRLSSVRTTRAIRLKKVVIRSNGLGYPFEKFVIRSNGSGYPFRKEFVDRSSDWTYLFKGKFQPSFHPKTISLLATRVERCVILQVTYVTGFVYKRIIYE